MLLTKFVRGIQFDGRCVATSEFSAVQRQYGARGMMKRVTRGEEAQEMRFADGSRSVQENRVVSEA